MELLLTRTRLTSINYNFRYSPLSFGWWWCLKGGFRDCTKTLENISFLIFMKCKLGKAANLQSYLWNRELRRSSLPRSTVLDMSSSLVIPVGAVAIGGGSEQRA